VEDNKRAIFGVKYQVQIEASRTGAASCGVGWSDGYWTMSEKYAITAHLDWDTDKTDEENIAAATGGAGTVGRVGTLDAQRTPQTKSRGLR
jgi:hypothetical protein